MFNVNSSLIFYCNDEKLIFSKLDKIVISSFFEYIDIILSLFTVFYYLFIF